MVKEISKINIQSKRKGNVKKSAKKESQIAIFFESPDENIADVINDTTPPYTTNSERNRKNKRIIYVLTIRITIGNIDIHSQ